MSAWVSVEDSLPRKSGYYKVKLKQMSDMDVECHYDATTGKWEHDDKFGTYVTRLVTHWMEESRMKIAKFHKINILSTGERFLYPVDMASAEEFWSIVSCFNHPKDMEYVGIVSYDLDAEWGE